MNVSHRLTGYDKVTELLVFAHDIPRERDRAAREIAHVPATDADAVGGYPLRSSEARAVARLIGTTINVDRYDWCYEPVAVPLRRVYA